MLNPLLHRGAPLVQRLSCCVSLSHLIPVFPAMIQPAIRFRAPRPAVAVDQRDIATNMAGLTSRGISISALAWAAVSMKT